MMKIDDYGNPIKRTRLAITVSNFDIIGPEFWGKHENILREALCSRISQDYIREMRVERIFSQQRNSAATTLRRRSSLLPKAKDCFRLFVMETSRIILMQRLVQTYMQGTTEEEQVQ